jgi:hypothetical protein
MEVFFGKWWVFFCLDSSGKESKVSVMAVPKQEQTMAFVSGILNSVGDYWWRRGWKHTQVRFHNLVKQLRT